MLCRRAAHTAGRICAADEALCRAHGFELDQIERQLMDETVGAVRGGLADGFDEAWAAGTGLELDAAVDLALRALD